MVEKYFGSNNEENEQIHKIMRDLFDFTGEICHPILEYDFHILK